MHANQWWSLMVTKLYVRYVLSYFHHIHSYIPTPSSSWTSTAPHIHILSGPLVSSQRVFFLVRDEFNLENRHYGLEARLRPVGRHGWRVRKRISRRSPNTTTVHGLGMRRDESRLTLKNNKVLDSCSLNSQVLADSDSQARVPRSL